MASGFIDIAFVSKQPEQSYDWIFVKEDEYLAVLPQEHPLAQHESIAPEELMCENFFMFRSVDGIDKDVSRYFETKNIPIVSTFTSNSDYVVLYMIAQGLGIGMQSKLILDLCIKYHPNLIARPLYPPVRRELGLAVKSIKTSSVAVKRFIQCVIS